MTPLACDVTDNVFGVTWQANVTETKSYLDQVVGLGQLGTRMSLINFNQRSVQSFSGCQIIVSDRTKTVALRLLCEVIVPL